MSPEHHRGMVLAIAFESLVKLTAFLAVGIFVTFGLYDGFADLFSQARAASAVGRLLGRDRAHWPAMLLQTGVAMTAIICLPRQFHVTVVENIEPRDLNLALGVPHLPGAGRVVRGADRPRRPVAPARRGNAGLLRHPACRWPRAHPALALLAFIGGASAATGMVIVASVALSTMVSQRHAPAVAAATPGKGHRTAPSRPSVTGC